MIYSCICSIRFTITNFKLITQKCLLYIVTDNYFSKLNVIFFLIISFINLQVFIHLNFIRVNIITNKMYNFKFLLIKHKKLTLKLSVKISFLYLIRRNFYCIPSILKRSRFTYKFRYKDNKS